MSYNFHLLILYNQDAWYPSGAQTGDGWVRFGSRADPRCGEGVYSDSYIQVRLTPG